MMGRSPQCYISSFVEIGQLVPEKKIIIYGRGGHHGHVTKKPRTKFCFPTQRRFHIKFGFDWASGFRGEDV